MKRLFIVEDEAIVAMELRDQLTQLGYDVCGHARNGEAALAQIPAVRPDLVIMDINLGRGLSGIEVASRLRGVVDVPVVYVTAYSDAELAEQAARTESFAYVLKPFHPQALRANVEMALLRHAAERQALAQRRQQAALAALARRALVSPPVPELIGRALRTIVEGLGVPMAACWEIVHGGRQADLEAVDGLPPELVGTVVADLREPVNSTSPLMIEAALADNPLAGSGVGSQLHIVLGGAPRPLRMLSALRADAQPFTEEERIYLQGIVYVVSAAMVRDAEHKIRARLLERVIASQDQERRWVARELHDTASQSLAALLVGLKSVTDATELEDARQRAGRLREITTTILGDLGRIARGLHPRMLDDLGLVTAAARHVEVYAQSCGLQWSFASEGLHGVRLPPHVEAALYRILQEALSNVARHAQARSVAVSLYREGDSVVLRVRDDGRGFDAEESFLSAADLDHFGLYGMRERAALFGGQLTVESAAATGTTVSARFPLAGATTF